MSEPRFSVVVPTYNRAAFVEQALDSVFRQTWTDHEIVVVDDGSTDGTRELLEPLSRRIRYVRQDNLGPAAARNTGIRNARGRIVGFLDSDDAWEPDTLARVAATFDDRPDAGLVSVMAREVGADGALSDRVYGKRTAGDDYSTSGLLWGDGGGCSWFFVRRELLETVGGYDESLRSAEECDLCLRLSFRTRLVALRAPLLLRRVHGANLSDDVTLNARSWIRILKKLRRDHPQFVRAHPVTFRRTLAKERMRLGRDLLANRATDPGALSEARDQLARSLFTYPFARTASYLAWSWFAPRRYAAWRRRELRVRGRR